MRAIIKLSLIITIRCFSSSLLSAQESTLRLISLSSDTLNACRINSLSDKVLFASRSSKATAIPIDSIAILERFKERHCLKGAVICPLVGAVTGVFIGATTYQKSEIGGRSAAECGCGLFGAVSGFVVEGVIGASSDQYKIDLRSKKVVKMNRLIIQPAFAN